MILINEASKNSTFSSGKITRDLLNKYSENIEEMLNIFIKNYDDIITNIKSSDHVDVNSSQEAYDEFCLNNDKNRLRQSRLYL